MRVVPVASPEHHGDALDAGINITLVYVASRNRVVLATSDNQRATQLLQSMM